MAPEVTTVTPSRFEFLTTSKGKLGIAVAAILAMSVIGVAIVVYGQNRPLEQRDSTQSTSSDPSLSRSSATASEINTTVSQSVTSAAVSKISKYTNKNYPKFSFKYDESIWKVTEKLDNNSFVKSTVVSVESAETKLVFSLYAEDVPLDAGPPVDCFAYKFKKVTDKIYRLQGEGETDQRNHFYSDIVVLVGSDVYNDYKRDFEIYNHDPNPTVCFEVGSIELLTPSKYAPDSEYTPIEIYFEKSDEADLAKADQVISTLTW